MSANPPTQYATEDNLAARQRLWQTSHREQPFDLFSWVLDLAGVRPGSATSVLDVGCGNGNYEAALVRLGHAGMRVALDLSTGMLATVRSAERVQADAAALPFGRSTFDLVLAPHMLYHVPDVAGAAREMRRVLRHGGLCVAVTNGAANLQELAALIEAAVGTGWKMVRPANHFKLENGSDPLASAFDTVRRVDCPASPILVTDADAVADYVASVADHYEEEAGVDWTGVVERVRALARSAVTRDGGLRFTTSVGAFVCQ